MENRDGIKKRILEVITSKYHIESNSECPEGIDATTISTLIFPEYNLSLDDINFYLNELVQENKISRTINPIVNCYTIKK